MNKQKLNYFNDLAMFIFVSLVFITGILKFPNLLKSLKISSTGLPWHTINEIHDWSGVIIIILVIIHLILHWQWIKSMTKNLFNKS